MPFKLWLVLEIASDTFFFIYQTTKNLISIWSFKITLNILTLIQLTDFNLKIDFKCLWNWSQVCLFFIAVLKSVLSKPIHEESM